MFSPPLDSGKEWIEVAQFSSPSNLNFYQKFINLSFPADALLVQVKLSEPKDSWQIAGAINQYWIVNEEKYQTAYSKIFLQEKTVISIEPLANSILLFRPVDWLLNWSIKISARKADLVDKFLLIQILENQQIILDNSKKTLLVSEVKSITKDSNSLIQMARERLDLDLGFL